MSRTKKTAQQYEAIYNDLKRFYRFKFKIKKGGFKPTEKSLLSRLDKQLSIYTEGYEQDTYTFVAGNKSQIRALKQIYHKHGPSALGKEQPKNKMVVTNKGVFIPQGKTKAQVDYAIAKPNIVGKGKNTRIRVDTPTRVEEFIPRRHGETLIDTYARIKREYPNVQQLYLDVRGHKGVTRYDPVSFYRYVSETVASIEQDIEDDEYNSEDVFTGFWILYWKQHPQFK